MILNANALGHLAEFWAMFGTLALVTMWRTQ